MGDPGGNKVTDILFVSGMAGTTCKTSGDNHKLFNTKCATHTEHATRTNAGNNVSHLHRLRHSKSKSGVRTLVSL